MSIVSAIVACPSRAWITFGAALGRIRAGAARDVLYLALEDGDRRLQARCRHLLADGEPIPGRFRYILAVPPGQVLAVIADALGRHPDTALIVLDTLGRIMPLPLQGETTTSATTVSPRRSSGSPTSSRV